MSIRWVRSSLAAFMTVVFLSVSTQAGPQPQPQPQRQPNPPAAGAQPLPIPNGLRILNTQELLGVQQSVFETLFAQPWDQNHWEYPLDAPVTAPGIYSGRNHLGQVFHFDIKVHARVNLATLPLTPEQRAQAQQMQFQVAGVIGMLSREGISIAVTGQVVARVDADGQVRYRFLLANTTDPNGAVFVDPPEPPVQALDEAARVMGLHAPLKAETAAAPVLCATCEADYQTAVDRANRNYNRDLQIARDLRNIATQSARDTFNSAKAAAGVELAICTTAGVGAETACLIGCAFLTPTGAGAVICVVGCQVGFAFAESLCIASHQSTMSSAAAARDSAINAANATYNTTANGLASARNDALQDALDDLRSCRTNCIAQPKPDQRPDNDVPVDPD